MKKWKCTVCGYVSTGEEPPGSCPVCGAEKSFFQEALFEKETAVEAETETAETVATGEEETARESAEEHGETETAAAATPSQGDSSGRKWKCTICGYIHTGNEPPDICPVCGADKSFFIEVTDEEKEEQQEETVPAEEKQAPPVGSGEGGTVGAEPFGFLGKLVMGLNLHPISVHTPNGIFPAAMIFLVLGMYLGVESLEKASFFNFIFVLLSMPVVYGTGYVAWKRKYRGAKTALFRTKLTCGAIVTIGVSLLVFWRFIDVNIALSSGTGAWIYLGIGGVVLVATGIAGHLGGKLVFHK